MCVCCLFHCAALCRWEWGALTPSLTKHVVHIGRACLDIIHFIFVSLRFYNSSVSLQCLTVFHQIGTSMVHHCKLVVLCTLSDGFGFDKASVPKTYWEQKERLSITKCSVGKCNRTYLFRLISGFYNVTIFCAVFNNFNQRESLNSRLPLMNH